MSGGGRWARHGTMKGQKAVGAVLEWQAAREGRCMGRSKREMKRGQRALGASRRVLLARCEPARALNHGRGAGLQEAAPTSAAQLRRQRFHILTCWCGMGERQHGQGPRPAWHKAHNLGLSRPA